MATDLSEEIVTWLKARKGPEWQTALLQKIAHGELVTNEDIDNFVSHSINDEIKKVKCWFETPSFDTSELSNQLSVDDFGVRTEADDPISLKEITHVRGVNALKPGASLLLSESGLNIVFGHNGSGKSGFTRIMKQFAASRGPETVLPNALGESTETKANVTFCTGDDTATSEWTGGEALVTGSLNRVRVFDSVSARSHISESNEVAYVPPQLEVLSSMVDLLGQVKQAIEDRQLGLKPPPASWNAVGDQEFNDLVEILGTDESKKIIEEILEFTDEDSDRLAKLEADLAKLKTSSPQKLATQLSLHAKQITEIAKTLETGDQRLSLDNEKQLVSLITRKESASKKLEEQAKSLRSYDLIDGLSEPSWGVLWESAVKFHSSISGASGKQSDLHKADRCPLCQQNFSDEAKDRIKAFQDFKKGELSVQLEHATKALVDFKEIVNSVQTRSDEELEDVLDLISAYAKEDGDDSEMLALEGLIVASHREIEDRKIRFLDLIASAQATKAGDEIAPSAREQADNPSSSIARTISLLGELLDRINDEAAKNRALAESDSAETNVAKEIEVLTRKKLFAEERAALREQHDEEALKKAMKKALGRCSSQAYTKLIKNLSSDYVNEIGSVFQAELKELGLDPSIPVKLQFDKAKKGINHIQVVYNDTKSHSVGNILSEGEQRIISIAGFYADLTSTGDFSTLIFDDPVSSLDQRFRKAVALRLVKESTKRQVLVFTHDNVFVRLLEEARGDINLDLAAKGQERLPEFSEIEIVRTEEGAGVHPPVDWRRRNLKAQIGQLKDMAQSIRSKEKSDPDNYPQNAKVLMSAVRETWERVVEERLLNGVVSRFGRDIQTKRLKPLHDISPQDIAKVNLGMTIESRLMTGHSTPLSVSAETYPTADKISQEVQNLDDFYKELGRRGRS